MPRKSLFTNLSFALRNLISCLIVCILVFINTNDAYADLYEGVRSTSYDTGSHMCKLPTFGFNPFYSNDDVNWIVSNPTCATYIATAGTILLASWIATIPLCKPKNPLGIIKGGGEAAKDVAPPLPGPYPDPIFFIRWTAALFKCAARGLEASALTAAAAVPPPDPARTAQALLGNTDVATCCGSVGNLTTMVGVAISALAGVYGVAKTTFENARVCGHDWQVWAQTDSDGNAVTGGAYWTKGTFPGSYKKKLEDAFLKTSTETGYNSGGLDTTPSITNKAYREFIYGGIEYEDNGDDACTNPSTLATQLGYTDTNQKYYMTGPGGTSVFACHRFLAANPNDTEAAAAYECCKNRSQDTMCIENKGGLGAMSSASYSHKFCVLGSKCTVSGTTFEAYASTSESSYICAKTYSLCPYDHLLGGGTETKLMDTTELTKVVNFCQFMNHCSKLPLMPSVRTSNLESAFISASCKNFMGDSQNTYDYSTSLIPITVRGFSAPIVQCFKETMTNLFLNKAGDTKCLNPDEIVDPTNNTCVSGYQYRKGQVLATQSFFASIQEKLQSAIKMTLSLSVMFFGMLILLGLKPIEKKQAMIYLLKIALVMYFAVGDAWQFRFMNGVLDAAATLEDLTFQLDESTDPNKLDGCQFPRFNYLEAANSPTRYTNPAYGPGKEYLRVWDTLDCKISRALGFGPEVSVPNFILMVVAGFFTGFLGILFIVGSFMFALFLISLTVRAIHIFLLSTTAVILLIYLSPITITCVMFERTKEIFNSWWKQLLGFTLQPMILFAYLGIVITVFDNIVIGDATFSGDPTKGQKRIECNNSSGLGFFTNPSQGVSNSVYCIFRIADIKTNNALSPIGVGIPMLAGLNVDKINSLIKSALILFVLTNFIDKIPGLASKLVGGDTLSPSAPSAAGMGKTLAGAMRGVQKRAMRASKKGAKAAGRSGASAMRGAGDKGKAVADKGSESAGRAESSSKGKDETPKESSPKGKDEGPPS